MRAAPYFHLIRRRAESTIRAIESSIKKETEDLPMPEKETAKKLLDRGLYYLEEAGKIQLTDVESLQKKLANFYIALDLFKTAYAKDPNFIQAHEEALKLELHKIPELTGKITNEASESKEREEALKTRELQASLALKEKRANAQGRLISYYARGAEQRLLIQKPHESHHGSHTCKITTDCKHKHKSL